MYLVMKNSPVIIFSKIFYTFDDEIYTFHCHVFASCEILTAFSLCDSWSFAHLTLPHPLSPFLSPSLSLSVSLGNSADKA